MNILWTIIVGFVAGAAAKYIMPGKEPGGFVMTTLLGIGGAFVGTFVGNLLHFYATGLVGHLISATGGAVLILLIYNKLRS